MATKTREAKRTTQPALGAVSGSAHREGGLDSKLARSIIGALKSCIAAHGPITNQWVGSAAKRVMRQLEGEGFVAK